MTLDLTEAPLARTRITEVDAAVGLGEMLVVVPEDARVTVESSVRAGGVDWPGGAGTSESGVTSTGPSPCRASPAAPPAPRPVRGVRHAGGGPWIGTCSTR